MTPASLLVAGLAFRIPSIRLLKIGFVCAVTVARIWFADRVGRRFLHCGQGWPAFQERPGNGRARFAEPIECVWKAPVQMTGQSIGARGLLVH